MKHFTILLLAAFVFSLPQQKLEARGKKASGPSLLQKPGHPPTQDDPVISSLLLGKTNKLTDPRRQVINNNRNIPGVDYNLPGLENIPAAKTNQNTPGRPLGYTTQLFLLDTVVAYGTDSLRYSYTWDGYGRITSTHTEIWRDNQWQDSLLEAQTFYGKSRGSQYLTYKYKLWREGVVDTANSYAYTYTYDASGYLLSILNQRWSGGEWTNWYRDSYGYDPNGHMLTWQDSVWDGTQWVISARGSGSYDPDTRQLTTVGQYWDGTQWLNQDSAVVTYDTDGKVLTDSTELWQDSVWADWFEASYSRDANGTVRMYQYEYWSNGQPADSVTSTFDAGGRLLTTSAEAWNDGQWMYFYRYTLTYDANGNELTYLFEQWNNGQLTTSSYRYTYTYDASGNELTSLSEHWDGSQWSNDVQAAITYDADGRFLTEIDSYWDGTQWIPYWRYSDTWDTNGHQLTWLQQQLNNGQWENYERDTLTYSEEGNLILYLHQAWTGSSWLTSIGGGSEDYDTYISMDGYYFSYQGYQVSHVYSLDQVTAVPSSKNNLPTSFSLSQNYPNPFNPSTTITFDLKETSSVRLEIYNVLGQKVLQQDYGTMSEGQYSKNITMSSFSSGVYFYRLTADGSKGDHFIAIKKMLLMK